MSKYNSTDKPEALKAIQGTCSMYLLDVWVTIIFNYLLQIVTLVILDIANRLG